MFQRKLIVWAVIVCMALTLVGCTQPPAESAAPTAVPTVAAVQTPAPAPSFDPPPDASAPQAAPKYVFLFIGDGMSYAQIQATQYYKGRDTGDIAATPLNFTQFPVTGTVTNYNTASIIPDSASSGTAIASGVKTQSGMLGQTADGARVTSIAQLLAAQGKKIGIVSSVTLNNATPAAFYAHTDRRANYDDITQQMASSGFDYFAGGAIYTTAEADRISRDYRIFLQNGYTVANTKEEIAALDNRSGKVYALSPAIANQGAIPFVIDAAADDLTLADFVAKGITVLDNENGFFMMVEGGKIDWACHANDAATAIHEMLGFEDAVQQAVDFATGHPNETLIIVTADHETGGMALGQTITEYGTNLKLLGHQNISYSLFKDLLADMIDTHPNLKLADVMPTIGDHFGLYPQSNAGKAADEALVLSREEYAQIQHAFAESLKPARERSDSDSMKRLYGGYDPLTATLTRILNNKAGIGWTTFYHTALPIPVYAYGPGAEAFGGSYDNTGIFDRLVRICTLEDLIPQ